MKNIYFVQFNNEEINKIDRQNLRFYLAGLHIPQGNMYLTNFRLTLIME